LGATDPITPQPARPRRWRPSPFIVASAGLHVAGAGALAVVPERWPLVAGALVLDHLAGVAAGLWPRSTLLGPNLRRLPQAGAVALTFDDGPDPEITPAVLDLLDARRARATFFCIGARARAHPAIVGETVRRGHGVGNHTDRPPAAFSLFGPRAMRAEIARCQDALAATAGVAPRWFRAPAGLRNPWLEPALAALGLSLVSWTRRGFDTATGDPARVLRRLVRGLAAGDVLLLHDRAPSPVLAVLPRLLDELDRRGLRAVALPAPAATA
jgi:peptidoglycan/xylan/chitin deacetylase (PgdA/CDA1 family)